MPGLQEIQSREIKRDTHEYGHKNISQIAKELCDHLEERELKRV